MPTGVTSPQPPNERVPSAKHLPPSAKQRDFHQRRTTAVMNAAWCRQECSVLPSAKNPYCRLNAAWCREECRILPSAKNRGAVRNAACAVRNPASCRERSSVLPSEMQRGAVRNAVCCHFPALRFAQRARCAAAILARVAALNRRRFRPPPPPRPPRPKAGGTHPPKLSDAIALRMPVNCLSA